MVRRSESGNIGSDKAKERRGGTYITIDDLAPCGDESVEILVNDELFYHAGDLTVPARPDSGMDQNQTRMINELMDQDDDHMKGKGEKSGGLDLGALERDLLEYQFSEDDLEPSDIHGEDMGRDTQVRDAVRNEGGVKPTHYARGSREANELRRV